MRALTSIICLLVMTGSSLVVPAHAQKRTIHESPHKKLTRSCEKCHLATSFKDIRFDHSETSFATDGHHADLNCLVCHSIEDFSKVESNCGSCHQDIHKGQMGKDCSRCHSSEGWRVLDGEAIHSVTNFPLLGRHVVLDCESCHSGMTPTQFRQTPSRCIDCHRADFDRVASPDHRSSGFSTDCQTCHQMTAWTPAVMSDHDAVFPIFSGAHNRVWDACAQCHINPSNNKIVSCLECHEHSQPLADPTHQGMPGYSYTTAACLSCHPDGSAGNFMSHDAVFPIFSGTHNRQWDDCIQCHTSPGNKKVVDCLTCHNHAQSLMDPKHQGMPGYSYTTSACLGCHPDGRKGNFLQHDAVFPIFSGTHNRQWDDCAQCHTNQGNNSVVECLTCHEHVQNLMDPVHQGMSGYSYASQSCLSCHPTGVAGRFVDHEPIFPIYSGAHNGRWDSCATCHTDPTNKKVFTCFECHEHNKTSMDDKHRGRSGYSYTSAACYDCHPDGRN